MPRDACNRVGANVRLGQAQVLHFPLDRPDPFGEMMRKSACLLAAVAALCLQGRPADAHAHLEKSQPAAGSKSAEVREIRLAFSEPLEAKLCKISLEDREDRAVVEPAAQADPADGKALVLQLFESLPPGEYKVTWVVVAADGHRMRGAFAFVVSR